MIGSWCFVSISVSTLTPSPGGSGRPTGRARRGGSPREHPDQEPPTIAPTWFRTSRRARREGAPQHRRRDRAHDEEHSRRSRVRALGMPRASGRVSRGAYESRCRRLRAPRRTRRRDQLRGEHPLPARRGEHRRADGAVPDLCRHREDAEDRRERRRDRPVREHLQLLLRSSRKASSVTRPLRSVKRTISATIPTISASAVRVVRSFSSSDRIRAITPVPPRSGRGRPLPATSSPGPARAGRSRSRPRARRPSRSTRPRRATRRSRAASSAGRPRAATPSSSARCGVRTCTAPATRAVSSSKRRLRHQAAVVDDHDRVDRLRHLGEDVTRHEHRLAVGGERAQEVAQPAHALRVEAVRRLVEHEELGVAEQRRREREPLPHAERVGLHTAAPRRLELDEAEHLVDARRADARRRGQACASGRGPSAPGESRSPREPRRRGASGRPGRGTACRKRVPFRSPVRSARAGCGASSSCLRRSGRGSP